MYNLYIYKFISICNLGVQSFFFRKRYRSATEYRSVYRRNFVFIIKLNTKILYQFNTLHPEFSTYFITFFLHKIGK